LNHLERFSAGFLTFEGEKVKRPHDSVLQTNDLEWLPLRSSHVQRKNYFKFRVCRALRSAPNAIFTGGVVEENGICNAAFYESAALQESFWSNRKVYGSARSPGGSCRAATEGLWMEKRKKR
jgi:hypothetical protein